MSLCSAISPDAAVFAATLDLFGRVTKHVDIWGRRAAETDYDGCKWAEVLTQSCSVPYRYAELSRFKSGIFLIRRVWSFAGFLWEANIVP